MCHFSILNFLRNQRNSGEILYPTAEKLQLLLHQGRSAINYDEASTTLEEVIAAAETILSEEEQAIFNDYFLDDLSTLETARQNHMTDDAPNSLIYMGICLGMATDKMFTGLRAKGVEAVFGYSQSVTFSGEKDYMVEIFGHVKEGDDFGTALGKAKAKYGDWDPAYSNYSLAQAKQNRVAFPITVSSEDA